MKNVTIANYESFNQRRYGNPWVAKVDDHGKLNFDTRVGAYTGGYNRGEAGSLYIYEPEEGAVYGYGQKDYRGRGEPVRYIQIREGKAVAIESKDVPSLMGAPRA